MVQRTKQVLISGAGIAGPALAFWLARRGGFRCMVVERSSKLRAGGQAVDFRGPVHREVLERMDMWEAIHARKTTPGDLVMLGRRGGVAATLPAVMMAGDVEILRGDLSELLHERTRDDAEYRFGDHITAIDDRADGAHVTFASGETRAFDMVVGADGLHSGVRAITFRNERACLKHHGYRLASFAIPNVFGIDRGAVLHSVPGRGVMLSSDRALLVHAGGAFGEERRDADVQKRALRAIFGAVGWETSRVLDALDAANDLYVDAIATVRVERYAHGRVVLLGDAAYGGTLGGQGSSLAIVGAYVLAGELAHETDLGEAFARYEMRMRPYATRCQKGAHNVGMFFAPRTRIGLAARNFTYGLFTTRWFRGFFERLVKDAATDFALPQYA